MELSSNSDAVDALPSFSLILGGPLFQLERRTHLSDEGLRLLRRRILVISLFAWFPLFVLAGASGDLAGKRLAVPFLLDLETHIRFLVVVPLLVIAEVLVHQRLLPIVRIFMERRLVPQTELARFEQAILSASRLRNSVLIETLLVVAVYTVGILIVWRRYAILGVDTWYATSSTPGARLTPAGVWYSFVSLPLFQFLLLRWYFRLGIWARFLWQVSRMRLALVPTHPDRLGGLGFLADTVYAFTVLLVAHGILLAAQIANRFFFLGEPLTEFQFEIGAVVLFLLCMVFGPLLVFVPQLSWAKRLGLREYGALAEQYVRQFDDKWVRGGAPRDEPLIGSSDIQSLSDMGGSFEIIRSMRLVPISRDALIRLALAVLLPMLPLLLTMMPLEQLLKRLIGLVF